MATLVGRMLGRYRLDALLGRGGMAEVYRATDTKLARTVAVKVILPERSTDAQFVERFLREARVVASLEHPHILPIYDFGEEEGAVWLVMPYMDGGTLRERMSGAPVPLSQSAAWIRQLADALDAAHAAGVLHRDVKPANVLVGKGERLALADFGIAKMLESSTGLTATGMVVGTPVYMAPEQAQGRPATAASDRYALAVLAYELLAGRPPFDGENALSLMHQHVTAPVPALSTHVRGLPVGLDLLFERALAKDPDERPASCRALADGIATFVPTGAHAVFSPEAPLSPPTREISSATVLQPNRPPTGGGARSTPPGAPPHVLTSVPTVATGATARGRGRTIALAAGGALLALAGVWAWSRARTPAAPLRSQAASAAVPTAVPTAAAAPEASAGPAVSVVELPPKGDVKEKPTPAALAAAIPPVRPAPAPPPTAAPPAAPAVEDEEERPGANPLQEAHRRLDPMRKGRRPTREDFAFALEAARRALAENPAKAEARFLEAYARAGLAYLDRRDDEAARLLAEAGRAGARLGTREMSRLWPLERGESGGAALPAWALAIALGDPRREAGALLEKAIGEHAGEAAPYLGRAALSRIEGRSANAVGDAKTAYEKAKGAPMRAMAAELAGEELARIGPHDEALRWLKRAVADAPPEAKGRLAARAAKVARGQLGDEEAARELLGVACRHGNAEACREIGDVRPRARLFRRGRG